MLLIYVSLLPSPCLYPYSLPLSFNVSFSFSSLEMKDLTVSLYSTLTLTAFSLSSPTDLYALASMKISLHFHRTRDHCALALGASKTMQSLCESEICALHMRMNCSSIVQIHLYLKCRQNWALLAACGMWHAAAPAGCLPERGVAKQLPVRPPARPLPAARCLMLSIQSQMGGQQNKSALHL